MRTRRPSGKSRKTTRGRSRAQGARGRKTTGAKQVAKPKSKRGPRPKPPAAEKKQAPAVLSKPNVVEAALAAFAHEVRTPLTGILAVSELLATSGLGGRERHWVDTIKASAEHLAALATLFVDAAKGKTAGISLRRDFFDLHALARAAGDSLGGRAAAKGLAAKVDIAPSVATFVIGDSVRLRAALENLIDNAVKFTERGEVGLAVTAKPLAGKRLEATFAVSDSGIGIDAAEIKRLFMPFSQANVSIARKFGGAGLGLSSVGVVARAMGGKIGAKPRRGGGMTFTLVVRLDRAEEADRSRVDTAPEAGARPSGRRLRVLCVEDNPFGRVILNTVLTQLGHEAEFVGRGEAAVDLVAGNGIDAVLMDMILPGIDGIESIRRIRALQSPHAGTPIIGVSGQAGDEKTALAAGANAFLVKPVSPRVLAAVLARATRQ
jgi:CheY-like chemotaxis protein